MKKTQLIEIRRNIQKSIFTFLAIAIIVSLGMGVYLGVHFAAQGLEDTNSRQYHKELFQDFEVTSVYGFTEEDVSAVGQLDQVEVAAGVRSIGVLTTAKGERGEGTVIAFSEGINQGDLRQGNMPKRTNECALEEIWAKKNGVKTGDTITVEAKSASRQEELKEHSFQVTGLVSCIGSSKKSAMIITPPEAFSEDAFSGTYARIVIRMQGSVQLPIYGEEYQKLVAKSREVLQKLMDERTDLRYQELLTQAETDLTEKESVLDDAGRALADAKTLLEEKEKQLQDGEKEIEEGKKKLEEAQIQLADGEKQLEEGAAELKKGEKKLSDAERALGNGRKQLTKGRALLDYGWQQLADHEHRLINEKNTIEKTVVQDMIKVMKRSQKESKTTSRQVMAELEFYINNNDPISEYDAVEYILDQHRFKDKAVRAAVHQYAKQEHLGEILKEWKASIEKIDEAKNKLEQNEAVYTQKLNEYNDGLAKYNAGFTEYTAGLTAYDEGQQKRKQSRQQYEDGKKKLAEGEQLLIEGREELTGGQKEYDEKTEEYKGNEEKIEKARNKKSEIAPVSCLIFGRYEEASYITIGINAQNLKKLGLSFAVSFMCVAIMACYAAIGRMVEEQRKLIGVQKAQGFFPREILIRYMCYGLSSTLLGIAAGVTMAYYLVQPILLSAYRSLGDFQTMYTAFLPGLTVSIAALVLTMAAGSVWLASRKLLKEQAFLLMKEPVPEGRGNRWSRFPLWKRIPLFTRVLLGNLFSEKKRVLTCITGIAGCTVLIVMGASLKIASESAPEIQYKQIYQYDKKITIKKKGDYASLEEKLSALGCESTPIIAKTLMFKVEDGLNISTAIMSDQENFERFVQLKDAFGKEPLEIPKEGVLMSRGTAEFYHIKVGDTISAVNEKGETHNLKVQGIFENYVGQRLVLSPTYYQQVCGQEESVNQYYVKLKGATQTEFQKAMDELPDVIKVAEVDEDRGDFDSVSGTLNQILIILVILSIGMAFMILTNLTAMNIRQKEGELAIMRVNGFTLRETRAYMMREAVIITLLGILLGVFLGQLLGEQSRIMMQNRGMQLLGGVKPVAWAIGAGISGTFSFFIHLFAMRSIKKIKLANLS